MIYNSTKTIIIRLILSLPLILLNGVSSRAGQAHGLRQGKPIKSVWEQTLDSSARRAQSLQIYGSGPLWEKTIGLGWPDGIEIRDKKLIASLLRTLHGSGQTKYWDLSLHGGYVALDFMRIKPDGMYEFVGTIDYIRRGSDAFCVYRAGDDPTETMAALRPKSGLGFEAFVRQMANRAKKHDRFVSFFEVHGD